MKRITIDAGKDAIDYNRDLDSLKKHLYGFLFSLKRIPEHELKWEIRDKIEPTIRQILKGM